MAALERENEQLQAETQQWYAQNQLLLAESKRLQALLSDHGDAQRLQAETERIEKNDRKKFQKKCYDNPEPFGPKAEYMKKALEGPALKKYTMR